MSHPWLGSSNRASAHGMAREAQSQGTPAENHRCHPQGLLLALSRKGKRVQGEMKLPSEAVIKGIPGEPATRGGAPQRVSHGLSEEGTDFIDHTIQV